MKILNKIIDKRFKELINEKLDLVIDQEKVKIRNQVRETLITYYDYVHKAFNIRQRRLIEKAIERNDKFDEAWKDAFSEDSEMWRRAKVFLAHRELDLRSEVKEYAKELVDGEKFLDKIIERILRKQLK